MPLALDCTVPPFYWRHNGRDCVSNHQPYDCLFNRWFRCRSKKTSKLRVTSLCEGNSPGPVNSPHKWPVTQRMFTFDDVIIWMSIKPSSWGIAAPGIGAAITVLRNLQFISSNHAATCSCFHVNRWGVLSIWRGLYGTCPHVNGVPSKIMPFVTQLLFL